MKNVMLFEAWKDYDVYDPTPRNIERKEILNRRLKEINVKQEIQKEIEFLEELGNRLNQLRDTVSFLNVRKRTKELKRLLEDL